MSELVLAGFPVAMARFIAAEGSRGAWLSSAVVGGLPLLAASVAVGEALAVVAGVPSGLMWMVICCLTIDAYYFSLLRGLKRFKLLAGYRVSANLAQLVLIGCAVAVGVDSTAVAVAIWSFVYLIPIAAIEVWRAPLRQALRGALKPDRSRVRRLTHFAIPALVSGLAYASLTHADVLFVQLLASQSLPDYAAARSLAQPAVLVPYAIAIVMLPAVAAAEENRRWRMLLRALAAAALAGFAVVAIYVVAASQLTDLLLPPAYASAAEVLPLLAAALAGMGLYSVLSQWWMGIGRPGPPALALAFGTLVTIGLQFALTPSQGGTGAAIAIGGGVTCSVMVLGAASVRHRRVRAAALGS